MKITEAASDERGALAHGKRGDQTGNEVRIREMNGTETGNATFTLILRYPSAAMRQKFAKDGLEIANNNFIGYAQYGPAEDPYAGRYGLHEAMKQFDRFAEVTIACNVDCSAKVGEILRHNGLNVNLYMRTANEVAELTKLGFEQIPFDVNKCVAGDILWRQGHTAVCVEGKKEKDKMYSATLTSSASMKKWASGAGPNTRDAAYLSIKKSTIGFKPGIIVAQQQGEILANSQWMRGQSHIYVANFQNDATAGVAVGAAAGYFNPDADVLYIPVRFTNQKYLVRIYE